MYGFQAYPYHRLIFFFPQLFTAGRYEYRNKGVDMFIEALARKYIAFIVNNHS